MSDLAIVDQYGRDLGLSDQFKKAKPPKLGDKFGAWAGRDNQYFMLPGGATLQFDLSQLTLADYRAMSDHYQISNSQTLISFMLHQMDWSIECENQRIADAIEDILRPVWTRLVRAFSQALTFGFSPTVIEWENDVAGERVVINKFKDLLPDECQVNWKTVYGYAPGNHARPKFYEYDGIVQLGSSYPIPPENTVWYALLMQNGDYYGKKLLKPAFPSWFFSTLIHLFANRYYERFGEPLPIGRADFDNTFDDGKGNQVTGKTVMEGLLAAIRSRAVAVLPSDRDPETKLYDFDIEYLESQMRGADFERYMQRLDEEMSMALFTPLLLMRTGDTGAYNLGVSHLQTWLWCLNAIASDWKDTIDRFIVKPIKEFNFGVKAKPAYWVPRNLGKDNAETLRAVITTLISDNKVKVDTDELGQALGMTVEEISEVTQVPEDPNVTKQIESQEKQKELDRQANAEQAKLTAQTAVKTAKAKAKQGGPGSDTRQRTRASTAKQRPGRGPAKP